MNKQISMAVLVVGIAFILYGIGASNSFSSDLSRIFTGAPTEKTIALLSCGLVFIVLGGYGMSRKQGFNP